MSEPKRSPEEEAAAIPEKLLVPESARAARSKLVRPAKGKAARAARRRSRK